jgi:glucose/arabinose dehydrogenase
LRELTEAEFNRYVPRNEPARFEDRLQMPGWRSRKLPMKNFINIRTGVRLAAGLGAGLILSGALQLPFAPLLSQARAQETPPPKVAGIPDAQPDQARAMMDVGYHFANLWFAADRQNWPLASYYLSETRSHLRWAVRIQPVRKTKSGANVHLDSILEAVDNTMLAEIDKAIENKDVTGFKTAYRLTIEGCYACHTAAEKPFLRVQVPDVPSATIIDFRTPDEAPAGNAQADDASKGKIFFQQNCALCHPTSLGPRNTITVGQGPSLVGVLGRRAATGSSFGYSKALAASGFVWDSASLDRFLANPAVAVPGTSMPIPVPSADNRRNLIAYLSTLVLPAGFSPTTALAPAASPATDPGDWHHAAPGLKHDVNLAALPAPFSTASAGNPPQVVGRPADATLSVPPQFAVKLFASGLSNPRLLRMAPNGDIFLSETGARRIRVLRADDGADAPSENQIFAEGLDRPFGLAFYPPGEDPQWIYVANNNSVVRFAYRNGDLKARDAAQVIVAKLTDSTGGHSTRDVAFSKDGKRMFISVGSGSNVAEDMSKKSPDAIRLWEADHGRGAAWDSESNRANILVTDPEAHLPLRTFATGIRNGVGLAVDKETGELWTSTNERDGLGDDLVPDYITSVKEGGFYGWPWYYLGNHEDPRHAGERPDLAGQAIVPDVPVQAHSASLEMVFYPNSSGVAAFPAEYRGDIFAAFHGSWNRSSRTGYKVVRVRLNHGVPTGEYDDFLTGFVVDAHSVWGRPVGVAVAHDGALLVTEDGNGTLWRIAYTGK